jgi:hypothetical protein
VLPCHVWLGNKLGIMPLNAAVGWLVPVVNAGRAVLLQGALYSIGLTEHAIIDINSRL